MSTVGLAVSVNPLLRFVGDHAASAVPMTTLKSPRVSMSRPPRSIVSRADHRASSDDDPGAQLGTVNVDEPSANSPVATGNSTFVTETQSSVSR